MITSTNAIEKFLQPTQLQDRDWNLEIIIFTGNRQAASAAGIGGGDSGTMKTVNASTSKNASASKNGPDTHRPALRCYNFYVTLEYIVICECMYISLLCH
jgi:hypothetical protein